MYYKLLLFSFAVFLLITPSYGQETRYTKKCGDEVSSVIYRQTGDDGLEIIIEDQKSIHHFDSAHYNISWTVVDQACGMDVTITLENGSYHVTGISNGKRIDKTVESKGSPWVQNLAYFCGVIVPEDGILRYECFRPGPFTLHQMTAKINPEESSDTKTCVRACPAGVAGKLFHADYFFSPETRKLNGYAAVEGGPGTPVTTWTVAE